MTNEVLLTVVLWMIIGSYILAGIGVAISTCTNFVTNSDYSTRNVNRIFFIAFAMLLGAVWPFVLGYKALAD